MKFLSLIKMISRQRVSPSRIPKRFSLVLLFGGLVGGFVLTASADEPANFQLRATAQADSTGLFLSQLVETPGAVPVLRLGDSPAFGKTAVLTREQIAGLLRDAGSELNLTNLTGATTVRITRRSRAFTEADFLNLLTETLQHEGVKDKGELELRPVKPWVEVNLPDEPLTLKILELPTAGVTASFITRFEIRTAREGLGIWQATLKAYVWREVWVAHSPVRRGEPLPDADLIRERRDVLPIREALADFVTPDNNFEFAEPLQANGILLNRALKPRTVLRRGQIAQAVLQDGALSITLKVEVLEDGVPGQIIRARNPLTHRDVSGKVLNEQTLLITL